MKFLVIVSAILAVSAAKPSGVLSPLTYAAAPIAYAAPIHLTSQYHAQDTLGQYNYGYAGPLSSKAEVKSLDGITKGAYSYIDAEGKLQSVEYTSDAVNGFRVAATNLPVAPAVPQVAPLPQPLPVVDTPEVAEAKAKHLAALEAAKVTSVVEPVALAYSAPAIAAPAYGYAYGINSVNSPVVSYASYAYPGLTTYAAPGLTTYAAPWVGAPVVVSGPVAPVDTPEVAQAKAQHLAAVEEVKARTP